VRAARQAAFDSEAKLAAVAISQFASRNPTVWVFENARVRGLLTMLGPPLEAERRGVLDGQLIAEQGSNAWSTRWMNSLTS
jgi:hypothetical protein